VTVSQENCLEEIDEKALAKAKRKAEKEAMIALQKKEEEERQRRKEEKLQEAEEAKKLKEAEMKLREEADRLKAQHEEQQRLEFEAVLEAERKKHERLNAEKILRKLDKKMIRLNCELEKERFFQISVFQDNWNQEQQNNFEDALLEFTSAVLKYDRWVSVALKVTGKTKQQCLARYKHLRSIALSNTDN
jgi:Fe-S cluster assembly scaffold protein SufB